MKIAVLGTGHVGAALGTGWARAGHEVTFGARTPDAATVKDLVKNTGGRAAASTVDGATASSEIVTLAIPWSAVPETLQNISKQLSGKVLIDCTNPSSKWPAVDHSAGSGGEQVAQSAPGARVVKAFNTTGFENMLDPKYADGPASMFYAGDDVKAKQLVHDLIKDLGFDPVDAGGLSQAHALEVLASFWGTLAYGQKLGRGIAFRLMKRT
jgi:8-hydroxy-5-deazaflavin:NADPH oxidoreductase